MEIYDAYSDVIKYAKALEDLIKRNTLIGDESLSELRKQYIKPVTNVAQEWIDNK